MVQGHGIRSLAIWVMFMVAVAACNPSVTPAPGGPTGSPSAQGSGSPEQTSEPLSSDTATIDPTTLPLPEPRLGSAEAIVQAMSDPDQAEQVVVSMLDVLGIGLYEPDGSPIRAGTETSDSDFYLFEPLARGLVNMLRDRDDPNEQMSFRDFHAALTGGGYGASVEELAAAYAESYAANPDAPISQFVAALGPIDVEGTLSGFERWLLLLDGFVPPNRATSAMAAAGGPIPAAAFGGRGWGVARGRVQFAQPVLPPIAIIGLQLMPVARAWRITVTASPTTVHEGHFAPGSPARISARLDGPAPSFTSPFGGATVIPAATGVATVRVDWLASSVASRHGSLSDTASDVALGREATTTYTPKQEDADGQGIEHRKVGVVSGLFNLRQLMSQLYPAWAPYLGLISHFGSGRTSLDIAWHERTVVITIVWTDSYKGVKDTIVFTGDLTDIQPTCTGIAGGPCSIDGSIAYMGTGTATGSRDGWAACNPGIDFVPRGPARAWFTGVVRDGKITIGAYADFGTPLEGIVTGAFVVPLKSGKVTLKVGPSPLYGELCPTFSEGEIVVEGLTLPTP